MHLHPVIWAKERNESVHSAKQRRVDEVLVNLQINERKDVQ